MEAGAAAEIEGLEDPEVGGGASLEGEGKAGGGQVSGMERGLEVLKVVEVLVEELTVVVAVEVEGTGSFSSVLALAGSGSASKNFSLMGTTPASRQSPLFRKPCGCVPKCTCMYACTHVCFQATMHTIMCVYACAHARVPE